jgi:hypothetical protein
MTPTRNEAAERLQISVHTYDPDDRARTFNEGFDEGWGQSREDLVNALSVLENYGDHHEWCPRTPCDCGFERELHELRGLRDQVKEPNRAAEREPLLAAVKDAERMLLLDVRSFLAGPDPVGKNKRDPYRADLLAEFDEWVANRAAARALIEKYGGGG